MSEYTEEDYAAIEAAVMESPRGRWFLREFARRNRAADTLMLLEAIRKLERSVVDGNGDAAEPSEGRLTANNLRFFEGDEDLFPPVLDRGPMQSPDEAPDRPRLAAQESHPKGRIVFIRRASSSETVIPLADEADEPASATRP